MRHYDSVCNAVAPDSPHQSTESHDKATTSIPSETKTPQLPFQVTWQKSVADALREQLSQKHANDNSPLLVSLVGIPGSGKSTSCHILQELLSDVGFMVMPFDGYHLPLEHLKQLPNAQEMIYRRGAPDTFDANALKRDLERIKHGNEPVVGVPGFDHHKGDPEYDAHMFDRETTKIVLCEGLYLLHDDHGFEHVKALFDSSIYVDANVDECVKRLKIRNRCIPGYTPEEIDIRCEAVDRVNAMTVERSKKNARFVVDSFAP